VLVSGEEPIVGDGIGYPLARWISETMGTVLKVQAGICTILFKASNGCGFVTVTKEDS